MVKSFLTNGGVVFLRFGDSWDLGHVFFHCLKHTFTKYIIYSARETVVVKLCSGYKTHNHSGLDFLNTSTLHVFHSFHIYDD